MLRKQLTSLVKRGALAALIAVSGSQIANAAWVMIDNFESGFGFSGSPVLMSNGLNGWIMDGTNTGTNTDGLRQIVTDPANASNEVLKFTGGGTLGLGKQVTAGQGIADGATGTIFFRFRQDNNGSIQFGINTSADSVATASGVAGAMNIGTPTAASNILHGYSGSPTPAATSMGTVASDTWYNLWIVLGNASGTGADNVKFYLQGGNGAFQTQQQLGGTFTSRTNSPAELLQIALRTQSANRLSAAGIDGGITYYDDFYINGNGGDLHAMTTAAVNVTATPVGGIRTPGQTVVVSNAAADVYNVNGRDSATVSGVTTGGNGFGISGTLADGSLAPGASQTGTITHNPAGLLNGPAKGGLAFGVAQGPNGAGTGSGGYAYLLATTVAGNQGSQSTQVFGTDVLTGLSGNSDQSLDTNATILGSAVVPGTIENSVTVAMSWTPQSGDLVSDIVDLTGTDSIANGISEFVLQMNYNPALVGDEAAQELSQSLGELRLVSFDGAEWVNAVALNHASDGGSAAPNFDGSYADFLTSLGGSPTLSSILGSWGVDTANDTVWAVLDHNSSFSAQLIPVPEPNAFVVASLAFIGFGAMGYRRRK